jgi:hypothetical protein
MNRTENMPVPFFMNYIDELKKMAGDLPAQECPDANAWKIETELPYPLPETYKEFLRTFGTGSFGNGELFFLNPKAKHNEHLELASKTLKIFRRDFLTFGPVCPLFPDKGGFVRVAHCTARSCLFLAPENSTWRLKYVDFDCETVTDLPYSVPEFVYKLYLNEVDIPSVRHLRDLFWGGAEALRYVRGYENGIPFFTPFTSKPKYSEKAPTKRRQVETQSLHSDSSPEERLLRAQNELAEDNDEK